MAKNDKKWAALFEKADRAGFKAGTDSTPEPMYVVQHANPLDDSSPIVKAYAPVMDGVCGFAWIGGIKGTTSFGRWVGRTGKGHRGYYGGMEIWVSEFGQSYERKLAYARAFAQVLSDAGTEAYGTGRLD